MVEDTNGPEKMPKKVPKNGPDETDIIEQKFGFFVIKRIDKRTKRAHVELKTRGEGMPLAEAVIILEGWVKKVKEELQKPYVKNLKFGR